MGLDIYKLKLVKDIKEPELGDGDCRVDMYIFDDHVSNHSIIPDEFIFEKDIEKYDFEKMLDSKGIDPDKVSILGLQYGNKMQIHDNGKEYCDLSLLIRKENNDEEWISFDAKTIFFLYNKQKCFMAETIDYIHNKGFKSDIALDDFVFSNDIVNELKRSSDKESDIQNVVLGENELLYFWS